MPSLEVDTLELRCALLGVAWLFGSVGLLGLGISWFKFVHLVTLKGGAPFLGAGKLEVKMRLEALGVWKRLRVVMCPGCRKCRCRRAQGWLERLRKRCALDLKDKHVYSPFDGL